MNTAKRCSEQPEETESWSGDVETRYRCGCPGRSDTQLNKKYLFYDKMVKTLFRELPKPLLFKESRSSMNR